MITRSAGSTTGRIRAARPRSPGLVQGAILLMLLAVLATFVLTTHQAPPPTIAEFAPQAVEQIADASAGRAGTGGSAVEGQELDDLAEAAGVRSGMVDVARVRQCVGDPPRQIEDPQSPPCVPYWSGDNGGATWRGVTRDEIRVVVSGEWEPGADPVLVAFFNRRFEFYGRQIRLFVRPTPGPDNPAGQRAVARAVYEQDRAFLSGTFWYSDHSYFDELSRVGVVGVHITPLFPETYLAAASPYRWTYTMANDRLFATTGNWFCSRLAGRNAVHAGDPVLQTTLRKPGIVLGLVNDWDGTSAEPMNAELGRCGQRTGAVIQSTLQMYDAAAYEVFMQNAMLQMKSSGVTTVTCLCDWELMSVGLRAATNQGYFPEWVLGSYIANDWSSNVRLFGPPEQIRSAMALTPQPMDRAFGDHASNWAMQEITGTGADPAKCQHCIDGLYRMWLTIASGVQMAGPNLTPETFEQGLHRAKFPNPSHRIMAGSVGFADGDHSMTDDVAEMWWSNTASPPFADKYSVSGTWCYMDGGARKRIGTFPSDDTFFSGACDNGSR